MAYFSERSPGAEGGVKEAGGDVKEVREAKGDMEEMKEAGVMIGDILEVDNITSGCMGLMKKYGPGRLISCIPTRVRKERRRRNRVVKMPKWTKITGRDFNFESLLKAIQKHLINLKLMGGQKKNFSILKN